MGGLGSGRRKKRQHRTVETCLMLDADRLSLMGNLRSGLPGFYHWPDSNASIGFRTELARGGDLLHLFWLIPITTASSSGEEWEDVADTVPLERRPRHFGGYSFYFRCPGLRGTGCGRRVLKLYLMHNQFRCRYCHQLVYASPYERPWERAFRRANMLRQQIDSNAGLDGVPEKPDDMPVEVYAHLLDEILQAETQAYQARADWTRRFVAWVVDRTKPQFTL